MPVTEAPSRDPEGRGATRLPASRPRLGTADMLVQLWRAKWLMLLVFTPVFALGLAAALSQTDQFEAQSRLIVAVPGSADPESLVQAELEFLRSPVVLARVLDRFPMSRLYPEISQSCEIRGRSLRGNADAQRRLTAECRQLAAEAMRRDFHVRIASKAPVIVARYQNGDAETAAEVLNALIGAYLTYRNQVLAGPQVKLEPVVEAGMEARLLEAESAIGAFLETQGISNFEAEHDTAEALYRSASESLLETDSRLQDVESQLAAYEGQIKSIRPQQELFIEDSTEQTLLDMKLAREVLLAKYLPGSAEVQEMDERIARAETFIDTLDGPVGTVRTGPNPRYEQLRTVIADLQVARVSLKDQQAALAQQIKEFEARQARMTSIAPRYNELMRKRNLIEQDLMSASGPSDDTGVNRLDGVRVMEAADVPVTAKATRTTLAALSLVLAGLAALLAGLLKALTRTGFATRRSVERTLDLPVLATVREV